MPGFPNYFMLAGPNTGIGHTSLLVMIEAQVAHVVGALRALRARGERVIAVRARRAGALERRGAGQSGADRVELRRVLELVSRRRRPQHHAVARLHLPLHPPHPHLRPRRLRPVRRAPRPAPHREAASHLPRVRYGTGHRRRERDRPGRRPCPRRPRAPRCSAPTSTRCAAEKTAAECAERSRPGSPVAHRSYRLDVADRQEVDAVAAAVHAVHGALAVLVNNAGVGMTGSFSDMTAEEWTFIRSINLDGVVNCCSAFSPPMLAAASRPGGQRVVRARLRPHRPRIGLRGDQGGRPPTLAVPARQLGAGGRRGDRHLPRLHQHPDRHARPASPAARRTRGHGSGW